MARLQILELPEGASDDRAPFVLVVDQYEAPPYPGEPWPQQFDGVAEKIGARAVLAFETTIEIPANDTAAYVAAPSTAPEFRLELGGQDPQQVVDATLRKVKDSINLADERTDIARDMHRLAKRKNELLDALGMDRTRSWDDILLSARALRAVHEAEEASIQRVRDLPMRPEMMNAQQEHPSVWMHGYECGVLAARSALRPRNEPTAKPTDA